MIPSVIPDPDRESRVVVLCISPSPLMGEEKGEGDAFAYSFPSFVRQPPQSPLSGGLLSAAPPPVILDICNRGSSVVLFPSFVRRG